MRANGVGILVAMLAWAAVRGGEAPGMHFNLEQREHLRRSLTLLQSSTPADRKTVRVLFYGQSITQQGWWRKVEEHLRQTFPAANLVVENRAIGGHSSQLLVKTAEADLYPFQPDLLIFHVYGSHIEYENIIRRVRERTCADILLQTDHITQDSSLEEETDPAKLNPSKWDAWMNHAFLPGVAQKYGACRADIHDTWKAFLRAGAGNLKAVDFLSDSVHLNPRGEALMADILKWYLVPLPEKAGYDPYNEPRVTTATPRLEPGAESVQVEFEGTRVDVVFRPGAKGEVTAMIDGRKPSAIAGVHGFTRVSAFPQSDWPILLRVTPAAALVEEDWFLQVEDASADGKVCRFKLRGSVTGGDDEGVSTNRFVSKSGRVVIEPDDWNVAYSVSVFKRGLPAGHVATWKSVLRGADVVRAPEVGSGVEAVMTVAQGLEPGRHVIELRGPRLGELVGRVRSYRPPGAK